MKLYLSGPMTGIDDYNFPAFNAEAARLRALGHDVINPAENDGGDATAGDWTYFLRQDIRSVTECEAVAVLPGWKKSKGAIFETDVAQRLSMPILDAATLEPVKAKTVRLIGLHGKMGAGKNEAARRLALMTDVVEVSYARKLKESAAALLGCSVADLEEWKNDPDVRVEIVRGNNVWAYDDERRAGMTLRSFLQRYGTESHRDVFGPDFWLDAALPIDGDYTDALHVVTDVRFPNEAERIRDMGGTVVGIRGPNEDTGTHVSEIPLACDWIIDNTTRDDGYAHLDAQLRSLLTSGVLSLAA